MPDRVDRRVLETGDQRRPFERDRDRILYSTAFRRLSGITQVASAAEGGVFHNRLTHTLKVAQVAQRLAQSLSRGIEGQSPAPVWVSQLDADACEAAALAHDLGHPPFGHIGEAELDRLVRAAGLDDGFEGNAQSFRIVARLAYRRVDFSGLNLTRATLNGILKYPWLRDAGDPRKRKKYGAYGSETELLQWARESHRPGSESRSLEAEVMDWADDVTYAVHDVEDFYRHGLLPIDRLRDPVIRAATYAELEARWKRSDEPRPVPEDKWPEARRTLDDLFGDNGPFDEIKTPYAGTREQRQVLRQTTALLVARYVIGDGTPAVGIVPRADEFVLERQPRASMEVTLLKELVWLFVIAAPSLRTQQLGHERIVREVFETLAFAVARGDSAALPVSMRESLSSSVPVPRAIADAIASFSEDQITRFWHRVTGVSSGTLNDNYAAW